MVSDEEFALAKKRALDTLLERYFRHGAARYPGGNAQFEEDFYKAYSEFRGDSDALKDADIAAKERALNNLFSFSHRLRPSLPGDPGGKIPWPIPPAERKNSLPGYSGGNKPNQTGSSQEVSMPPNGTVTATSPSFQTFARNLKDLRAASSGISGLMAPNMETVAAREKQLKNYLGSTDYDKQTQESEDLAKLQIALSLMQRGFAAAGATPVRGESAASTLSRELLSPVAGDITPIASGLLKQRREVAAAKRQEERQLRLAALQDVKAEDQARRDLALALTPKPTATTAGLFEATRYVLEKDGDGTWKYATPEGGPGRIQVRQRKAGGSFYNVQSQQPYNLKPNQIAVLPGNLEAFLPEGETDGETLAAAQYHLRTPDGDIYTITDPNGETRTPMYKATSKTGLLIEIGTGKTVKETDLEERGLSLEKVFAPTVEKETAPKGVESAEAISNYEGFLADLGRIQENRGFGNISIKFDPVRHNNGEVPFVYSDGTPLSEKDGKRISTQIEKMYYNFTQRGYKAGQQAVNLNEIAAEHIFKRSLESYGLKAPQTVALTPALQVPPERIRSKQAQLARYKMAPNGFSSDPIAENTLVNQPVPTIANYTNGVGRLKLFQEVGVPFGEDTTSPAALRDTLTGLQRQIGLNERANAIGALARNPDLIQSRVDAEAIARGTALSATLNAQANTSDKRDKVVSEALKKRQDDRAGIQQKPGNQTAAEDLGVAIQGYDRLSRIRVLMARSRVPGFFTGPVEVAGRKLFGLEVLSFLRTPEAQQAANEFSAVLPILEELASRQALKAAGEGSKMSDKDLQGMKRVFPKAGENFDYSVDKVNALDRHLRAGIQSMLEQVGDFRPSDALLRKAASLGFDLKSIKGRNDYYSPFLQDQNYRVTNQPIPSYSKEHQTQLRNKGILSFVATGVPGQPLVYELMRIGNDGNPIWDAEANKWSTTTIPESKLTNPGNQKKIQFNIDWLKREHRLDR